MEPQKNNAFPTKIEQNQQQLKKHLHDIQIKLAQQIKSDAQSQILQSKATNNHVSRNINAFESKTVDCVQPTTFTQSLAQKTFVPKYSKHTDYTKFQGGSPRIYKPIFETLTSKKVMSPIKRLSTQVNSKKGKTTKHNRKDIIEDIVKRSKELLGRQTMVPQTHRDLLQQPDSIFQITKEQLSLDLSPKHEKFNQQYYYQDQSQQLINSVDNKQQMLVSLAKELQKQISDTRSQLLNPLKERNALRDSKMNLTEKIAPKSRRGRSNNQGQPKQVKVLLRDSIVFKRDYDFTPERQKCNNTRIYNERYSPDIFKDNKEELLTDVTSPVAKDQEEQVTARFIPHSPIKQDRVERSQSQPRYQHHDNLNSIRYYPEEEEKIDRVKLESPNPFKVSHKAQILQRPGSSISYSNDESFPLKASQTPTLHMKKTNSVIDILQPRISKDPSPMNQSYNMVSSNSSLSLVSKIKTFLFSNNKDEIKEEDDFKHHHEVQYKCQCGHSKYVYGCKKAINWIQASNSNDFDYEKNKQLYEDLLNFQGASGSEYQIERDIPRTFQNTESDMNSEEGQQRLQRVLLAFSKYDQTIGYVQGMNFIVGSLLYHCSEEIAFWLFVSLIEDYEMRDIYQPRLPGLYKHSQVLQLLQMEHIDKLYLHFCEQNIMVEMYASDWIFTLFSNVIPITQHHLFFDNFFQQGWSFFYRFSLTILKCLQGQLLDANDLSEILTIIKLKGATKDTTLIDMNEMQINQDNNQQKNAQTSTDNPVQLQQNQLPIKMKSLFNKYVLGRELELDAESFKDVTIWAKIISLCQREWKKDFNEAYIIHLLSNFDLDKLIFNNNIFTPIRDNSNSPSNRDKTNKEKHRRNSSLPSQKIQANSQQKPRDFSPEKFNSANRVAYRMTNHANKELKSALFRQQYQVSSNFKQLRESFKLLQQAQRSNEIFKKSQYRGRY